MNTFDSAGFNFDMLCHTYSYVTINRPLQLFAQTEPIKYLLWEIFFLQTFITNYLRNVNKQGKLRPARD
jgi:hypothetical protein